MRKVNRHHSQKASALKAWCQLITVASVFLIILPRCVGCKSPVDQFWEKKQKRDLENYIRNNPEMQNKVDEEMRELIRKSGG